MVEIISTLHMYAYLNKGQNKITGKGFAALAKANFSIQIKKLYLSIECALLIDGNPIGCVGVKWLVKANMPILHLLVISNTSMT